MEKPEDFAGGIVGAEFCSNCVDKDGFPRRYSEIIKNLKSKLSPNFPFPKRKPKKWRWKIYFSRYNNWR